jgi:cobalt-precorrin-5B (C1)-methyltransferase
MSQLRNGFTTGTCAAAAAKAAVMLLLEGVALKNVEITLPDGGRLSIPLVYVRGDGSFAEAAIRKDGGDDPDITHGLDVVASVRGIEGNEIEIIAGEGVGTVTKPGLSVSPGEPAVNPVPRHMIRDAVREVTDRGIEVTLSIPGGRERAAKTFNPRLGIVGGLSILGTSGRVRPFSCPALRASLRCLLDVAVADGIRAPVFVPGNIGKRAAKRHFHVSSGQIIEVSNEWGFMLECAAALNFEALMVLGHPGKLAKLAMGEADTHSSRSKSAVPFVSGLAKEVLDLPSSGGKILGGGERWGTQPERHLTDVSTVEGVFSILSEPERNELGNVLADKIRMAVSERTGDNMEIAVVIVNMKGDALGSSGDLSRWM